VRTWAGPCLVGDEVDCCLSLAGTGTLFPLIQAIDTYSLTDSRCNWAGPYLVGDEVDVGQDEVVGPAVVERHVAQRVHRVQPLARGGA
jgi:hypothetical protein